MTALTTRTEGDMTMLQAIANILAALLAILLPPAHHHHAQATFTCTVTYYSTGPIGHQHHGYEWLCQ